MQILHKPLTTAGEEELDHLSVDRSDRSSSALGVYSCVMDDTVGRALLVCLRPGEDGGDVSRGKGEAWRTIMEGVSPASESVHISNR